MSGLRLGLGVQAQQSRESGSRGLGEKSSSSDASKPEPTVISIRLRNSDYGHSHICGDYQTHSPKKDVEGHGVPPYSIRYEGLLRSSGLRSLLDKSP